MFKIRLCDSSCLRREQPDNEMIHSHSSLICTARARAGVGSPPVGRRLHASRCERRAARARRVAAAAWRYLHNPRSVRVDAALTHRLRRAGPHCAGVLHVPDAGPRVAAYRWQGPRLRYWRHNRHKFTVKASRVPTQVRSVGRSSKENNSSTASSAEVA